MPVVKLTKGKKEWLVHVGDLVADRAITDDEARAHALRQANGNDEFLATDGGGWKVEGVYPDEQIDQLRAEMEQS